MFLCFVPGRGSSRPWAWWGWLDGWAYLWAISAPLAVPAPSTRASGLGERPRPAAVGRGAPQVGPKTREWRTTPAATKKRSAAFPLGMANALRPGLGSNSSQPRKAGWIPQGGGRPLLWRFFGDFLIGEKVTPAERPRLGCWSAPEKSEKHQLLHQKAWPKAHRDFSICAPWGLAIQAGVWYTTIVSRVV